MRLKRRKPRDKTGNKPGNPPGKTCSGHIPERVFGRQIDADLTEDGDSTDPDSDLQSEFNNSAGFIGAEFPDPDEQPPEPRESPVITHTIVRERAMRLLVHREHGRKELENKLLQRELPPDLIVSVLDQLVEEGLQCDVRFAESYTRMRIDRGFGSNKIRADLQARRLEHSVIEGAIRDSGADWSGIASSALSNKFMGNRVASKKLETGEYGGKSVSSVKTRARMQRFLYQRGFEAEQIRSAMNNFEATHS